LAAGLRPDPLGELVRSPRSPSRNGGACLVLRGRSGGRGEGLLIRGGRNGREEGTEREGEGIPPKIKVSGMDTGSRLSSISPVSPLLSGYG